MRTIFIVAAMVAIFGCAKKAKYGFQNPCSDFNKGRELAMKTNKKLLILFDLYGNNHSKILQEVFASDKLKQLSENYIYVHVYVDDPTTDTISRMRIGRLNSEVLNQYNSQANSPCFVIAYPNSYKQSTAISMVTDESIKDLEQALLK